MGKAGRPFVLTRKRIGHAVLEVGFEDFSVKKLATHLGVSEKTLYNYAPGRNGLLALGLEQAMRQLPRPAEPIWSEQAGWREILERIADEAWRFMCAVPAAAELLFKGVHSRAEAQFSAGVGIALMERGFTADEAVLAISTVFELATSIYVAGQRMDVPPPGESEAERVQLAARLMPAPAASTRERELLAATVRAMWEPARTIFDRRLALFLDGIQARCDQAGRTAVIDSETCGKG